MNDKRKYFEGVDGDDYAKYEFKKFRERTGFSKTDYYNNVMFSMKLYQQALQTQKDLLGNPLSMKDLAIAKRLISRMTQEIKYYRTKYLNDSVE